jgi:hypothetical protein
MLAVPVDHVYRIVIGDIFEEGVISMNMEH